MSVAFSSVLSLAIILKPFIALVMFGLIALPIRLVFQKFFPDCKLKTVLLRPLFKEPPDSSSW